MDDQLTCGKGLAENSVLPGKLGDVIASMATVLEWHMKALDLNDPNAKKEFDAYLSLYQDLRKIGDQLHSTADEMVSYRDLPMGRHDMQVMANPKGFEAFENFVKQKQALLAHLQTTNARDQQLLNEMKGRT